MLCERCGERPATVVHSVKSTDDAPARDEQFCEACFALVHPGPAEDLQRLREELLRRALARRPTGTQ